jgi:(p)ppGpp synthase/HD superfamily hydrolase
LTVILLELYTLITPARYYRSGKKGVVEMIQTVYLREQDLDGSEIFGSYQAIQLKNRAVVVFEEEGMSIHRLKEGSNDIDFSYSLFFAHFFLIGDPCKEVDIKRISKMSAVEFFEYLVTLREARIKCSFR